jgi:hypothetical protein
MEYTDLYFTGFILQAPAIVAPKPSFKVTIQLNYTNALLKWHAPRRHKLCTEIIGKAYRYVDYVLFGQRRMDFKQHEYYEWACHSG